LEAEAEALRLAEADDVLDGGRPLVTLTDGDAVVDGDAPLVRLAVESGVSEPVAAAV